MDSKKIFSRNLRKYMALHDKTRKEVSEALGISYYTFTDWVNGKKYPRMDKVEMLADYFGILKSDLIEEKPEQHFNMQKENSRIAVAALKMQNNEVFFSVVDKLLDYDDEKLSSLLAILK